MRKKDRDANVWSIAGAPERGAMRALIINVCGHSPMATSMNKAVSRFNHMKFMAQSHGFDNI
jgi:hypothetical protein